MNGWAIAFGATGMILSVVTALVTMYRAWRKRVVDATSEPFNAGVEAVNEARIALQFKDERLADAQRRTQEATELLEQANARSAALQRQVEELYAGMGRLSARNAELQEEHRRWEELLRAAGDRERLDRDRIRELELRADELTKRLGPGPI